MSATVPSDHQSDKVLIIGAGLAGLALARVLSKGNVPFEIFERDSGAHSRQQGWAVALIESLPAMKELMSKTLVDNLHSTSVNCNTGDHDEVGFASATTGEKFGSIGGKPLGQPGSILRVSRDHFREFLWQGVDDSLPIQVNAHFTHYTEDAEGVTAYFADGHAARGSVLVGADGAHSHVSDQLLAKENHRPTLSNFVPAFGEADVPPHIYEPLRERGNAVVLATAPGLHVQIGMMSMENDKSSAHYFWAIMPRREEPRELSEWMQHASKEEIYNFTKDCVQGLHPFVTDLIGFGGVEAVCQQARFIEFEPPSSLPKGRVTVIGDAIHSMIPLRGAGANTAILDACDLGRLFVQAKNEGRDLSSVLPAYHEVMIPRGIANVRSSHAVGEMDEKQWVDTFRRR